MKSINKSLTELHNSINNGSFILDDTAIGKTPFTLLCSIYKQAAFGITINATQTLPSVLYLKCTLSGILPEENAENVYIWIFDAGTERHVIIYIPIQEYYDIDTYVSDYQLSFITDGTDTQPSKIAVEGLVSSMDFTKQAVLFSSLDYSADSYKAAFYPTDLQTFIRQANVKPGINFPTTIVPNDSVTQFFKGVIGDSFESVTACDGLIHKDPLQHYFQFGWPINTEKTFGPVTFKLNDIRIQFPLFQQYDNWIENLPVICATGSVKVLDLECKVNVTLNAYARTIILALNDLPTLRDFIKKTGISDLNNCFADVLSPLLSVYLSRAEIVINYSDRVIESLGLTITTEDDLTLIPDILQVTPVVEIDILYPFDKDKRQVTGSLNGKWKLGGKNLVTKLSYPTMDILVGMAEGETLDTGTLVDKILPKGFNFLKYEIEKLQLTGNLTDKSFCFNLLATQGKDGGFNIGKLAVKLDDIHLALNYDGEERDVAINATLQLGNIKFNVAASYLQESGLELSAFSEVGAKIPISRLAEDCLESVGLPMGLPDFDLEQVVLMATPKAGAYTFRTKANLKIVDELNISIKEFSVERHLKDGKSKIDGKLSAVIELAKVAIYLNAAVSNDEKVAGNKFSGGTIGLNVSLSDLLKDLLQNVLPDYKNIIPAALIPDIILTGIYMSYDSAEKETNLVAVVTVAGKDVNFFFQHRGANPTLKKDSRFVFGIQTDITDLSGLPLIGEEMKEVNIKKLGFVYTSFIEANAGDNSFKLPQLTPADKTGMRVITPGVAKIYDKGFSFSGEVKLPDAGFTFPLSLPVASNKVPTTIPEKKSTEVAKQATLQSNVKWFKLDKKLGPVTVGQVGFKYEDGSIALLISGNVAIAALDLKLNGLAVSFVVSELFKKEFKPTFSLDGIGLQYSAPPISVSATFLRTRQNGIDVYNGAAIIKAAKFTITAMGSYAKVQGQTSLFIYGLYEGAIGGPAFFFVTGIAAGFGYNRRVNVPSINELASFPLVALAMNPANKSLDDIITSLDTKMTNGKKPVDISLRDYFLAVGIKFTSFKIIESFVLLTVNFGTSLEFAILGLSRLTWPEKSISKTPIVYIELAILAHFGPASEVISVEAIITPNSYLLSKDCKLSGGFAFYTWVSGKNEGDFVVSLGGYHPKFKKPAHYPTVPRLALNWKVSDLVTVKGEMYYAITPSAIMAGGKWEVSFRTSIIKASMVVWADMLISWAPFQYAIDLGICVKIEANVTVAFIHIHFSLEMSAELHIWGPPFAGEAYVDWSIISFTIPFGDASKAKPALLDWDKFSTAFVPQKQTQKLKSANNAGTSAPDPINIMISNGIINKKENQLAIANPQELLLSIESFIPVTKLSLNEKEIGATTLMQSATGNATYNSREQHLGVRPCGFTKDDNVVFSMNVTCSSKTKEVEMGVICIAKGVTEALWGGTPNTNSNASPGTARVIPNVLSGLMLKPLPPPQVSSVREFDFSKLFDVSEKTFNWKYSHAKTGAAYNAYDVLGYFDGKTKKAGILEKTYHSVKQERENILSLLRLELDDSLPAVNETAMDEIMSNSNVYFRSIPVLCEAGEIPQYATDVV